MRSRVLVPKEYSHADTGRLAFPIEWYCRPKTQKLYTYQLPMNDSLTIHIQLIPAFMRGLWRKGQGWQGTYRIPIFTLGEIGCN